jgi:hypothetical protein
LKKLIKIENETGFDMTFKGPKIDQKLYCEIVTMHLMGMKPREIFAFCDCNYHRIYDYIRRYKWFRTNKYAFIANEFG